MTAIVGIAKDGKVWMGADSCSGNPGTYEKNAIKHPKVFQKGEFIIGYTSSFRMGQLIEIDLGIPELPENIDLREYMIRIFIPALRNCLKSGGFAYVENNEESGGEFLIGIRGCLFLVQSDFSVLDYQCDYAACGCGAEYCLGSIVSTEGEDAEQRIIKALTAAATFSAFVMPPFVVKFVQGVQR